MDMFDIDPEHSHRSNGSGDWWDRLTSGSRLWSADGSAAREHFPIADPQPAQHASRTKADSGTDAGPSSGLTDGEPTSGDAPSAASADSAGAGACAGSACAGS
ncbi:hypothetical protein, partial [Microbispora bryophytorum]|uniref:hypothetical protein n=1 Tax=Microbispora bryophytorum TaxID=1460882 RepID=UPI0033F837BC